MSPLIDYSDIRNAINEKRNRDLKKSLKKTNYDI